MNNEVTPHQKEDGKPVVTAMITVIIIFIVWLMWPVILNVVDSPVHRMNDAYFYNLADQAQTYYQGQVTALGWNTGKGLSKTCGHVISGGPAFGEGDNLRCQIGVTINNTSPQTVTSDGVLVAQLKATLLKEGFRLHTPMQVPSDSVDTPLLLGVANNGCNTTLDAVYDPGFTAPAIEYSLSCGGDVARDVPPGFAYLKVTQAN